jgi:hypothetical protein
MNQLGELIKNKSYEDVSALLWKSFGGRVAATKAVILIKSQIPMYIGNLNPLWEFWNNVLTELIDKTEDEQFKYFNNNSINK